MTYNNIHKGIFISRPNRFIAEVEINGQIERCHVKNTGRCKEILIAGTTVYVNKSDNPNRATKYDLVKVFKGNTLINIDSQAPNHVFKKYLQTGKYLDGITTIKPESKYGKSRFDFYVETALDTINQNTATPSELSSSTPIPTPNRKIFIEVKGVTLEQDGIARFPDAPTERGIKHLVELAESIKDGYEAHVVFIIQMKGIGRFEPNYTTHAEFGDALIKAQSAGVKITALDCIVTADSLTIDKPVPVMLGSNANNKRE